VLREGGVIADGFDANSTNCAGIQTNCGDFCLALEPANANARASPR